MRSTLTAPADRFSVPLSEGEVELFLAELSRDVEAAIRARRALLQELLHARRDPTTALQRAGRAGRRCVRSFDDALLHLDRTRVPSAATECAFELRQWLAAHVEACDLLSRAAGIRDKADLQRAIRCLAVGASRAERYNDARHRLMRQMMDRRAN